MTAAEEMVVGESPRIIESPTRTLAQVLEPRASYLFLRGSLDTDPDAQSPSSSRAHRMSVLLMGGQSCGFYGAAAFSSDADLEIISTPANSHKNSKVCAMRDLRYSS